MKIMVAQLHHLDMLVKKHWYLVILFFAVILLRLPNFFEPYWYGDEGIYLTIGQSLAFGRRLYAEIIDHKTPLIYYLALTPNQLWFRTLLLVWSLVLTGTFYYLSRALLKHRFSWLLASVLFVIFTTLPWLEGNLPNGELFVMGFVLVAAAILTKTSYFNLFSTREVSPQPHHRQPWLLLTAGGLLGLGILTKVPALFDFVSLLAVAWLTITRQALTDFNRFKRQLPWQTVGQALLLVIGAIIPIGISIIYFVSRGSGQAYLDFGLMYNFRYAGSWTLPFTNQLLLFFFTLPGKTMIMAGLILIVTGLAKWVRPAVQFGAIWLILALFAALLSNRPYPHYLLQVIPPAALLLGAWWETCFHRLAQTSIRHSWTEKIVTSGLNGTLIALIIAVSILLGVYFYPTVSYYQNWFNLMTGQMSLVDYRQSFNTVMTDNYQAAEIIKPSPNPYLFIWGTNPMLYALTKKIPTGRFTVAFHIKDFQAYDETLAAVIEHKPDFIVVMHQDEHTFPAFTDYLQANYMPNTSFEHFSLWRRSQLGYN